MMVAILTFIGFDDGDDPLDIPGLWRDPHAGCIAPKRPGTGLPS